MSESGGQKQNAEEVKVGAIRHGERVWQKIRKMCVTGDMKGDARDKQKWKMGLLGESSDPCTHKKTDAKL
jgi:hypothetical protein